MTPENFCYWMQGFAELTKEPPTPEQWKAIQDHLATVFNKVTPQVFGPAIASPALPNKSIQDMVKDHQRSSGLPMYPLHDVKVTC